SCTLLPFLKKRKVGMALTESSAARSPTSSTSTLRNTTLVFSWLIFSMAGAMRLHGPHHVAKKSTTTYSVQHHIAIRAQFFQWLGILQGEESSNVSYQLAAGVGELSVEFVLAGDLLDHLD